MFKDKGVVIGILATVLVIAGGIFFFSKPASPNTQGTKISDEILVPAGTFKTAGIADGKYLPASDSAQVTLVEFGDYECPACAQYSPLVKQLMTESGGKINFVFRNFPLPQHKNAVISAKAAESAGLQGKFWEMHEKLYAAQSEWAFLSDPTEKFAGYAQEFGLDVDRFKADMNSDAVKTKIDRDTNDAYLLKINSTPTYFVNGVKLENLPFSYNDFKSAVTSQIQ
jgi:protein-disulfide isomerase